MKTKIILSFLFLPIFFTVFAQTTTIQVVILNNTQDVTGPATVSVFRLPDSLLLGKNMIHDSLLVEVNTNTSYFLKVTAAGKESFEKIIQIAGKPIRLEVQLLSKITGLDNVTIVSRKPFVTQDDDKTVVDAEVLANSSTNAYEVLEKTPGVIIDQDGNVYLNSSTPSTIQVNGRDVKLSTADLASLLKSLPANSVLKIEILRSPSAKYDAASSGGIVNIVLKKGIKLGTSGNIHTGYFLGTYRTTFAGFSINKAGKKLNSYFSYQSTGRNNFEKLSSVRYTKGDTALSQSSFTKYPVNNHYVGGGIDLQLTPVFSIGYDLRFTLNNNKSNAINDISIGLPADQVVTGRNQSLVNNRGTNYYITNDFTAKYKIDTTGSEWTASLGYNYFKNENFQYYRNIFISPVQGNLLGDGETDNIKNIIRLQSDLVLKLKFFTVESGVKLNHSNSYNNALYFYEINGSGRLADSLQTNRFRYKETISAAYLQVAKTIFGFTIKPGLRLETTHIKGTQQYPGDTTFTIKRNDLFPYLYIRHTIIKLFGFTLTGNAIYRRSITRPYYEALNPYRKYIDLYLFDAGNPQLQPQFTTNYEFNIMADDYPVFSIGANHTKNIFTNVTYTDSISKIAYRTYDNLGKNKEIYFRIVAGIPPGKKYFFYAGAQHNLNDYNGFYQKAPLHYKRGSWVFFMYNNYKVTQKFNITINGFMRLKGLQNFYELNTFGSLNMSFNRAVLNKKGNIILSVTDILRTNKVDFEIQQTGIHAYGSRMNDTRRLGITFRYNFGIKPKEEKKEIFESPDLKNE